MELYWDLGKVRFNELSEKSFYEITLEGKCDFIIEYDDTKRIAWDLPIKIPFHFYCLCRRITPNKMRFHITNETRRKLLDHWTAIHQNWGLSEDTSDVEHVDIPHPI